jgi:tetratricopeptide (TPR) repeat protein
MTRLLNDPSVTHRDVLAEAVRAVGVFEGLGDDLASARAWGKVGRVRFYSGRSREGFEAYARSREHARRAGNARLELDAIVWTAVNGVFGAMSASEGLRLIEQIRVQRPGDPLIQSFTGAAAAAYLTMLGRTDEARVEARKSLSAWEELGQRIHLATGKNMSSTMVEVGAGNLEEALSLATEGAQALRAMGETGFFSTASNNVARILLLLGRDEEADEWTRLSEANAAEDDAASQMDYRGIRAVVLARRGDLAGAERLAREAVAIAEQTDYWQMHGDVLMDLAEVLRLAGRNDEAADAARHALALFEQKEHVLRVASTRAFLDGLQA